MSDLNDRFIARIVTIREARVDDAAAIASIHVRAWQTAYRGIFPDAYLDSLSIDKRTLLWRDMLDGKTTDDTQCVRTAVALDAAQVVGWVTTSRTRDADKNERWGEVQAIYVDPVHQSHGVGRALIELAVTTLAAQGYNHVSLWVLSDNARARRFYERMGFFAEPGSEKHFVRAGVELGEIRYVADLPEAPTLGSSAQS